MDTAYWNDFYSRTDLHDPSGFAKFCRTFLTPGQRLADLGCGSGRDSVYFARHGLHVTGIDTSEVAIAQLESLNARRCEFVCADFTELPNMPFDVGYMRWSLHAVPLDSQHKVLRWLARNVQRLFIECRSVNDALYGRGEQVGPDEFVTTHYRRFLRMEDLERSVNDAGFAIFSCHESQGWSRSAGDDPTLIRLLATKRTTSPSTAAQE
jgi:SAM-dependent methyltransferase